MTSNDGVHKCSCDWDDQCRKLQSSLKASDVWFGKIKIKAKKGSILRNLIAERFRIKNPERDYYIARHHWDPIFIMYLNATIMQSFYQLLRLNYLIIIYKKWAIIISDNSIKSD